MRQTKTKKEDLAQAVIDRIMAQPIPTEGQLKNPMVVKRKIKSGKQITMSDLNVEDIMTTEDVSSWSSRTFVDYFAKKYQDETGGNYRKVYRSDCQTFLEIGKFLASNGLEKNEWTKSFIDWCFKKRMTIIKKEGHFTPQNLMHFINHFYQEIVLPRVEKNEVVREYFDDTLLNEIKQADQDGKANEIFMRFGIPVASSYFINHKGMKQVVIQSGLQNMIGKLFSGTAQDKEKLGSMFQKSIIRSPYPEAFSMLNWREIFTEEIKRYDDESWWRDEDYKGKPLSQYTSLLSKD